MCGHGLFRYPGKKLNFFCNKTDFSTYKEQKVTNKEKLIKMEDEENER
jgi:hypothetical protein